MVAVLCLAISIVKNAKDFSHLVGIILKVSPILTGLEPYLNALARWSDEYPNDA